MKRLLLLSIRLYWRYTPPSRRRVCLFRKSCSHFVYEATETAGAAAGLHALWRRFRQCRTPIGAITDGAHPLLLLADGAVAPHNQLSPNGQAFLQVLSNLPFETPQIPPHPHTHGRRLRASP